MAQFNKQQQYAIDAPTDKDILVSAGAGSGKTKTLAQKVFEIIVQEKVQPSQLLVLTFTNNAAHEMKTRIVSNFETIAVSLEKSNAKCMDDAKKENRALTDEEQKQIAANIETIAKSRRLAPEMLSAHVQTFDSFNQYIVSKYSARLGIADSLSVGNDSVLAAKKVELANEIVTECYEDPAMFDRIVRFCEKYDFRSDEVLKKAVLDLQEALSGLLPSKRAELIRKCKVDYISDAFVETCYHEKVTAARDELKQVLQTAYLLEKHYDLIEGGIPDKSKLISLFSDASVWRGAKSSSEFRETKLTGPLYQKLSELLDILDDEDFVKAASSFAETNASLKKGTWKKDDKKHPIPEGENETAYKAPYMALKAATFNAGGVITRLSYLGSKQKEKEKLLENQEYVLLVVELVEELDKRFRSYKETTNCYSFDDIGNMAIRLLTEDEFTDVAEELRKRFTYIMVDEYQDTNDKQEIFLNSLTKPLDNGTKAHIFCVGDAKQAIYAFRGSKVELFNQRRAEYRNGGANHEVIDMNTNYRSGSGVLADINAIFVHYMTPERGGIDYRDPAEQLNYDWGVDLYQENQVKVKNEMGIYRIIPSSAEEIKSIALWEAKAILQDIKDKIEKGYLIYDRDYAPKKGETKWRKAKASDFVVLMRKKKQFELYQKLFTENGIKVNTSMKGSLMNNVPLIVLSSLVRYLSFILGGEQEDEFHLFASIARSYLYRNEKNENGELLYSDTKIHQVLSAGLEAIHTDPIYVKLSEFADEYRDQSFDAIFRGLMLEFKLIEKLHYIGDVSSNVSKLEALYSMIITQQTNGEGLQEFVNLLKTINKNDLSFDSENVFKSEDAVDIMTIHASKGLQQKIVYMPVSCNRISTGSNFGKPLFQFSEERGIVFPHYEFNPESIEDEKKKKNYGTSIDTIADKGEDDGSDDLDEHARLLYVALTRAENAIIFVGREDEEGESVYAMLARCPHHVGFDRDFIEKKIAEKAISRKEYDDYVAYATDPKLLSLPLDENALGKDCYPLYRELGKKLFLDLAKESVNQLFLGLKRRLYDGYVEKLKANKDDVDFCAFIYAACKFPQSITDFDKPFGINDLDAYLEAEDSIGLTVASLEETEDQTEIPEDEASPCSIGLQGEVVGFVAALIRNDTRTLGIKMNKEDINIDEKKKNKIISVYLDKLVMAFDHCALPFKNDYGYDPFNKRVSVFNSSDFKGIDTLTAPAPLKLSQDDSDLEFTEEVHIRASETLDEDSVDQAILDRGNALHRLLELTDIKTGSIPYVDFKEHGEYSEYRAKIAKVLETEIMVLAKSADEKDIHQEYKYYDPVKNCVGTIDLLFIKDGIYYIVDYKSGKIGKDGQIAQLHSYKDAVALIYGVDPTNIKTFLISLSKAIQLEID